MDQSPVIREPHLMAALALWDDCERSVRFRFGECVWDPLADEVLRLLHGCPDGMTRTEITNYLSRNVRADRIGSALGQLLQHGLARYEEVKTKGRSAERWHAVRK